MVHESGAMGGSVGARYGAVEENVDHLLEVRREIQLRHVFRAAKQQAFAQFRADHLQKQLGGPVGVGEIQGTALDLAAKIIRDDAIPSPLGAIAHFSGE